MINTTPTGFHASVSGYVIYLDTWAYIELAGADPKLRRRFLDAVHSGADVLFSVTNAAELAAQKGDSARAIKAFLDGIGPCWFPARLNPIEIIKSEIESPDIGKACVDEDFFKAYVLTPEKVIDTENRSIGTVSNISFSLGRVVELLAPQWSSISAGRDEFDALIKSKMTEVAERERINPGFLNRKFPAVPFSPRYRANFVYHNLMRQMAIDPGSLKKGDSFDLCHSVAACAYSTLAALDTGWRVRASRLPKPNQLPRFYSRPNLDSLVGDLELLVSGVHPRWALTSSA